MMLFLETGIRVNELHGLSIADIRWEDSLLRIRNAKTYRERLVPIQREMKNQLKKYVSIRGHLESDALFVTIEGTRLTRRGIQQRLILYGKQAGIKDVRCSPHTFRHTFAKLSVQQGANIFELQAILKDKLPDELNNEDNIILRLSQKDKLFRIENRKD
jgi:integrase/recombinase XerD